MARVTVEDCVDKVSNRFDLVMLAAQRARNISAGEDLQVDRDNDKNPVVALREIADERLSLDGLGDNLVRGHQKFLALEEEAEEDIIDFMAGEEEEWRAVTGGDAGDVLVAGTDQITDATGLGADAPADGTTEQS